MNKFSLLIVEDEQIIRDGFARVLATYDDFTVYSAKSAEEGLQVIFNHPIDVMLLDIKLPELSGIDMLYQLRSLGYVELMVIIISGHTEFDYAHRAIELRVDDYLLKPVTPGKLRELAVKITQTLKTRNKERIDKEQLLKQIEISKPLLQQAFLTELMNTNSYHEHLLQQSELIGIDLEASGYRVVIVNPQLKAIEENKLELQLKMEQIHLILVDFKWEFTSIPFYQGTSSFVVIQMLRDGKHAADEDYRNLRSLVHKIRTETDVTVAIGIGEWIETLASVPASYQQASMALAARKVQTFGGINPCRYYREIVVGLEKRDSFSLDKAAIRIALQELDEIRLIEIIQQLCSRIGDSALLETLDGISFYLHELTQIIIQYQPEHYERWTNELTTIFKILAQQSPHEYKEAIISTTKNLFEELREQRNAFGSTLVASLKKYIHEHYRDDMSLTAMALQMKYSPNYLGALFKKETGTTIHDYWHVVRMEYAKKLLSETSMYVFEVAEQVGYKDQYYFSALFKRFVGTTPKQYRS
ncbi:MAG: response regulator [Sphaerochaetaceae bacterium]|nr:response regulator [Sphaerochaetaceae bacterium]NLO60735.1 response regulator [Spirochaetales bacterium]MDD2407064.1 response regulator [Sphaerochaetaceae bacterium]MDD4260179.1 response regulator [Sphaerochaetaceae bacterium]MDD4762461.1 response regulator [Sphaerochaetaceae bacterium]